MSIQKRRLFEIKKRQKRKEKRKKTLRRHHNHLISSKEFKIIGEGTTRNGFKYFICQGKGWFAEVDGGLSADGKILISERIKPKILQEAFANHEAREKEIISTTKGYLNLDELHPRGLKAEKQFMLKHGTEREIESWREYRKLMSEYWSAGTYKNRIKIREKMNEILKQF